MFYISEITHTAPITYRSNAQERVYSVLKDLDISYDRVDTDAAIEMESCLAIDKVVGVSIVKTLFLCNRQKTQFYLFITCGDKPFRSKDFSASLGVSRVSFAPSELLEEMMGSAIGGTSILRALLDTSHDVQIVIDQDTINGEWFGCSDTTAFSFMRLKTSDLLKIILPYVNRDYKIITLPYEKEN